MCSFLFLDRRRDPITFSIDAVLIRRIAARLAFALVATYLIGPAQAVEEEASFLEFADTSSPRSTLKTFIDSCNLLNQLLIEEEYLDRRNPQHRAAAMRVLDCLDLSELPAFARDEAGGEAAICIKEIIDRVPMPNFEQVPEAISIGIDGENIQTSRWRIPGTRLTIARIEEGPQKHEYVFTTGTVERAPAYYRQIEDLPYRTAGPTTSPGLHEWYMSAPRSRMIGNLVNRLPNWARRRVFGMAPWQWLGLCLAILLLGALAVLLHRLQSTLVRQFSGTSLLLFVATILLPIAVVLLPLGFGYALQHWLAMRGTALYVVKFAANLAALVALTAVVFAIFNRVTKVIIASPRIPKEGLDAQFIRIIARVLSIVVAAIVFLEGGRYLGIPLTTLLASAGVGGLAVALAAQDALRNLFGTMMLLADKPFRVGERIIFGSYDGVVEEIGLRSTKIRLLTGHQAVIPNDELAKRDIENVGRRPHIRRVTDIHLPLDTPRDKVERAVELVRKAVQDHEGMDPEFPPRVYFSDLKSEGFVIRVIYWHTPADYWAFMKMSERVNFDILRSFEQEGIQLRLPQKIAHTTTDAKQHPIEVRMVDEPEDPSQS